MTTISPFLAGSQQNASGRPLLLLTLLLGVLPGCWQPHRRSELPYFASVAAARSALPAACHPVLYSLNGELLPDSVRVYALDAAAITRVGLVHGSGVARCPVVAVETKQP